MNKENARGVSEGEIPYGTIWQAKEPPDHSIFIGMPFRYYESGTKYFTLLIDGDGRSKLLSESFIREHYVQQPEQGRQKEKK